MRGFLANTDYDWYDFLRQRPGLDEVNFWRPSGKTSRLAPGTPFLFKLKAPHYAVAGFGYFARASAAPASLAWEAFGERKGAWVPQPSDWGAQTVSGASYDLDEGEGRRVWEACLARATARPPSSSAKRAPPPATANPSSSAPASARAPSASPSPTPTAAPAP